MSIQQNNLIALLRSLAIVVIGALISVWLGLPIPYLLGSMIAATVASLSGLQLYFPVWLRNSVFIMLGMQAGSGVRPETFSQLAAWPVSFMLLILATIVVTGATYWLLRRVFGWDAQTALFSSLPGALSFVLAAAEETKADIIKITIIQTIRILLIIAVLAPALNEFARLVPHGNLIDPSNLKVNEVLILLIVGGAGAWIGHRSKLPGGMMLGALCSSSLIYVTGFITLAIPSQATEVGMVILGLLIGSRVNKTHRLLILQYLPVGILTFLVGTLSVVILAGVVWILTDLHPAQIALAFAPGALEALTMIAFTLGVDPAYVAAHHVVRFTIIAIAVPFLARSLKQRAATMPSLPD